MSVIYGHGSFTQSSELDEYDLCRRTYWSVKELSVKCLMRYNEKELVFAGFKAELSHLQNQGCSFTCQDKQTDFGRITKGRYCNVVLYYVEGYIGAFFVCITIWKAEASWG